jgi:UDP-N-acetylmuramoyl-tripeptide--D-alanyl-D-alanine ligase
MMEQLTIHEITAACNGTQVCGDVDVRVSGMSFDSRTVTEGNLYVPLVGERVDGHDFIEQAFGKGAAATLTVRHVRMDSPMPYIRVDDPVRAMQDIAACYRKRLALPVIGITGSVGKTSTRAMVAQALSAEKEVYQTQGNLNSQLGVPVMVMGIQGQDIAVLEMGVSEFGEMERLTRIVQPDIAVVTGIGLSHIQQFKTKENIYQEKIGITHRMKPSGVLLLNGDDELLRRHYEEDDQDMGRITAYLYGTREDCAFRAENIRVTETGTEFDAVCLDETVSVTLTIFGRHHVENSLAALAACKLCGVSLPLAAKRLQVFQGVKMRQQLYRTKQRTILDDSYNANPMSMRAGIQVLADLPKLGRSVAVLGDMFELGDEEVRYHKEIGEFAAEAGIDFVVTIGRLAAYISQSANECQAKTKGIHFSTKEEATPYLKEWLTPADVVLVKASHGMALWQVVAELLEEAEAGKDA